MPSPATVDDVAARFWRPLTDHETAVAQTLLEDAWALLTFKRAKLQDDLDAGTVTQGNVIRVLSAMVARVLNNPQGKSEEALDDYRYKRDASGATGSLMVTPEELLDLTPVGTVKQRSVRLVTRGDR